MFGRKKIDSGAKKLDKLITSLIIGSAIASIFWLSQTKKGKEITKEGLEKMTPIVEKSKNGFLYYVGKFLKIFSKKK